MLYTGGRRKPGLPRFKIFLRDGFRCIYCGRSPLEDGVTLHVDHVKPLCRGGSNEDDNLATACAACNLEKGLIELPEETYEEITQRIRYKNEQLAMMLQKLLERWGIEVKENIPKYTPLLDEDALFESR